MELYHLDWERSSAKYGNDYIKLIIPIGTESKVLARKFFEEGDVYELVATSEAEDVEELYKATQNDLTTDSWSIKPPRAVRPTQPEFLTTPDGKKIGRRSTAMGDIVVKNGQLLLCAAVGFETI